MRIRIQESRTNADPCGSASTTLHGTLIWSLSCSHKHSKEFVYLERNVEQSPARVGLEKDGRLKYADCSQFSHLVGAGIL
jgi:hypothetical protein